MGARDPRRSTTYATVAGADVTATRGVSVVSSSVAKPTDSSGSSSSRAREGAARRPEDASTSAGFAAPSPEKTDAFTGAAAASATCTENPSEGRAEISPAVAAAEATKTAAEEASGAATATPSSSGAAPPAPRPATISARVGAVADAPPAVTTQNTRPGLASATRRLKDPSGATSETVGGDEGSVASDGGTASSAMNATRVGDPRAFFAGEASTATNHATYATPCASGVSDRACEHPPAPAPSPAHVKLPETPSDAAPANRAPPNATTIEGSPPPARTTSAALGVGSTNPSTTRATT